MRERSEPKLFRSSEAAFCGLRSVRSAWDHGQRPEGTRKNVGIVQYFQPLSYASDLAAPARLQRIRGPDAPALHPHGHSLARPDISADQRHLPLDFVPHPSSTPHKSAVCRQMGNLVAGRHVNDYICSRYPIRVEGAHQMRERGT